MPPQVRINSWVQSKVTIGYPGSFVQFGLNWRSTTAGIWTVADLTLLNSNIEALLITYLRPLMPAVASVLNITSTDLSPLGVNQHVRTTIGVAGTATGESVPYNVACCMSLKTGQPGRAKRGRLYLPPMSEDHVTAALFTGSYVNAATAFGTALVSFVNTGGRGIEFAVPSRSLLNMFDILSVLVDAIPDSQRRRLQGRGT